MATSRCPAAPLLERRAQAQRPETLHSLSFLRDRIVHPSNRKTEEVQPEGCAPGLERSANPHRIVARLPAPPDARGFVPGESEIVEDGAFKGRKTLRHEAERGRKNGESNFAARHSDLSADQAVQLGAAGFGIHVISVEALVPAVRSRGIPANQIGASTEDAEPLRIASDP